MQSQPNLARAFPDIDYTLYWHASQPLDQAHKGHRFYLPISRADGILSVMTELILIRHGQTHAEVAGRWEGWSDDTLTPLGQAQADAVTCCLASEYDRVVALYASPLRRAIQTARIVGTGLGLQPISMDALREINFGKLDGITLEEMEARHPALFARWKNKTDMGFKWPEGERRTDFFRRAGHACDYILALHPNDSVVIVAHGGTLRACLAHLLPGQLGQWWGYTLDNCGLTRVSVEGDSGRLLVLNDVAHLPTQ
jgi:broad specificity phosphatase PhoE